MRDVPETSAQYIIFFHEAFQLRVVFLLRQKLRLNGTEHLSVPSKRNGLSVHQQRCNTERRFE